MAVSDVYSFILIFIISIALVKIIKNEKKSFSEHVENEPTVYQARAESTLNFEIFGLNCKKIIKNFPISYDKCIHLSKSKRLRIRNKYKKKLANYWGWKL